MIYLRNATKFDQWLVDPITGIKRKIDADGLARVSAELADHMLRYEPVNWVRVTPITPPPPPGDDQLS